MSENPGKAGWPTRGPRAAAQYWPSASTTTMDFSGGTFLLRVKRDAERWIVSEDGTAAYGAGRTLLEAMTDLWQALLALPDVVERHGPVSKALERAAGVARSLTEVCGV